MSTKPASYTVTRKKTSVPNSPMRVILAAPVEEGNPDGGFADGGTFALMPGESASIPAAAAPAFMADAYHQDHFDIDPPLPKKVIADAVKADEARADVPAGDDEAADKATGKGSGKATPKK
jgi:hypothetical protein